MRAAETAVASESSGVFTEAALGVASEPSPHIFPSFRQKRGMSALPPQQLGQRPEFLKRSRALVYDWRSLFVGAQVRSPARTLFSWLARGSVMPACTQELSRDKSRRW